MELTRLDSRSDDFQSRLKSLCAWESACDDDVLKTVTDIIADVRARGDAAVLDYTRRFDKNPASKFSDLEISVSRQRAALQAIDAEQRDALQVAYLSQDYSERNSNHNSRS